MSEWQPIETAPKDGTPILAYNPVTGPYATGWDEESASFPLGFWGRLGRWYPVPTHWAPLPSPPNIVGA